jgi:hypothetical protein
MSTPVLPPSIVRRAAAPWWGLLLVAVIGCRRNAPAPPVRPAPRRPDAGVLKVTRKEAPEPPPQRAVELSQVRLVERTLCRRGDCCVIALEDAGTDQKGRSLLVAETAADLTDCLIERPPRKGPPPKSAGQSCRRLDHDLVVIDKGKARPSYTLSSECEFGGPSVNYHFEEDIEVDPKAHTFAHDHHCNMGTDFWDTGVTVGLDPPRVLESRQSAPKDLRINWELLRRLETWRVEDEKAAASAQATPPPDAGEEPGEEGEGEPGIAVSALSVPKLALPAAFTGGGWKTTDLGSCGVLVDGKDNGYTLHGEASAADATLRVVWSTDGVLFVEVTDDKWTGPSRSWVKDDHLELWVEHDGWPGLKEKGTAVQWGIRIADGATFPAYGSPEPLTGVEVVRRGSVARVKIPFAPGNEDQRFALVYSDGDDGKTQERLIATSELTRGRGDTLGGSWTVDPADATCAMKGHALAVVRPVPSRDKPLADLGMGSE